MTLEQVATSAHTSRAAVLRLATLAIAALFAFVVLAQGISAPFQKDAEPQSAEWIQSIVRDGQWLIPTDAYGYTDRKPPLFYWLAAASMRVFGANAGAARLAPLLGATLGATAGLLGVTVLQFRCPLQNAPHLLVWHGGVLVVATVAGSAVALLAHRIFTMNKNSWR